MQCCAYRSSIRISRLGNKFEPVIRFSTCKVTGRAFLRPEVRWYRPGVVLRGELRRLQAIHSAAGPDDGSCTALLVHLQLQPRHFVPRGALNLSVGRTPHAARCPPQPGLPRASSRSSCTHDYLSQAPPAARRRWPGRLPFAFHDRGYVPWSTYKATS